MSIIRQDFGNVSGGDNGIVYGDKILLNGVEATATTDKNQTFTIDTGLTTIKHFILRCRSTDGSYWNCIEIDTDEVSGQYYWAITGYCGQNNYNSTTNNRQLCVVSVSGGVVTLCTASINATFGCVNHFRWYAE